MATSLKTVTVMKTRKAQACIWCGETIEAGTSCTSHIYIEDHKFCDDRFHPECDKACQEFYRQEKCWGEPFSPYEFARGSTLEKGDYRIMQEREQASTRESVG